MFLKMISSLLQGTNHAATAVALVLDQSVRTRLRYMRAVKEIGEIETSHDNFLRGRISSSCSLHRVKQANRIGLYYWRNGKENACREYTAMDFPRLQCAETAYLDLMKKDPTVAGGIDFTQVDHGLELNFLSSFMAGSIKGHMQGQYVLFHQNENENGYVAIPNSAHVEATAPPKLERSIVLPVKRIPTGDGKSALVFRIKQTSKSKGLITQTAFAEVEDFAAVTMELEPYKTTTKRGKRKAKAQEIADKIQPVETLVDEAIRSTKQRKRRQPKVVMIDDCGHEQGEMTSPVVAPKRSRKAKAKV